MNLASSVGNRGGSLYLGKDILGSVRSSSGEYGTLEDRYEYDAFGKPYKGDLGNGMSLGYTGKPYDATTGLYNYGYRDYKPEAARFTTLDPVRDGSNWFAYVNNDPVNWIDLWGLNPSDKPNSIPVDNYDYKQPPETFTYNNTTWVVLDEWADRYHEQGQPKNDVDPQNNNKYVSENGLLEAVYNEKGALVTDPVNKGTDNQKSPLTDPIGHFIYDVVDYWINGTGPDDPTQWYERVFGTYNGQIPD